MLSGLLDKPTCAKCRFCCVFDNQDFWEMPSILKPTAHEILKFKPNTMLVQDGEVYTFSKKNVTEELYPCPALTDNGCSLSAEFKPFECSIWPFRVMKLYDTLVLTICNDCDGLKGVPNSVIDDFANSKVRRVAFEYAQKYPQSVKLYHDNYRIIND